MQALESAGCTKRFLKDQFRARSPLRSADIRWVSQNSRTDIRPITNVGEMSFPRPRVYLSDLPRPRKIPEVSRTDLVCDGTLALQALRILVLVQRGEDSAGLKRIPSSQSLLNHRWEGSG